MPVVDASLGSGPVRSLSDRAEALLLSTLSLSPWCARDSGDGGDSGEVGIACMSGCALGGALHVESWRLAVGSRGSSCPVSLCASDVVFPGRAVPIIDLMTAISEYADEAKPEAEDGGFCIRGTYINVMNCTIRLQFHSINEQVPHS